MSEAQEEAPIRVLLVDDEPDLVKIIRAVLAQDPLSRFQVASSATLGEAIDRLARESFDLILLDLGLPDSSGLDTLERVHARSPEIPVIVFTVTDDQQVGLDALRQGAQEFLVKKEANPRHIARAIRYAIERKHAERVTRERDQLAQLNRTLMDREDRILELKREVNELLASQSQPKRYQV
ncbi:MAG TPA: response regulator [bacterium]